MAYDFLRESDPAKFAALNKQHGTSTAPYLANTYGTKASDYAPGTYDANGQITSAGSKSSGGGTGLMPSTQSQAALPQFDYAGQLSGQSAATGAAGKSIGAIKAAPTTLAGTGMEETKAWKASVPAQINDSVADKVKEITSQDSMLMQGARTDGLKLANRRGLLNSSMAVGASQSAVLDKALPIAAQDASQSFQKNMAANDFTFRMEGQDDQQRFQTGENFLDRGLQKEMTLTQIASTEGLAAAQRQLELVMQSNSMAASDRAQIRDIASREGLAAAERQLQATMQGNEIKSREGMQQTEIAYQTGQQGLDRTLQEKLAGWNLKSSDRNAAAQFLTNMESMHSDQTRSIMANTNLDAATRTAQLASANALRDRQLGFVEQMYNVDIKWTDADYGAKAAPARSSNKPFDGVAYLKANPDVAAAVARGEYNGDPAKHYAQYGKAEGRTW